jgi:hypothetical protein
MAQTKLSQLTDEELLNRLAEQRAYSWVIDELCSRIEASIGTPVFVEEPKLNEEDCPVCCASLGIRIQESDLGNRYKLEAT